MAFKQIALILIIAVNGSGLIYATNQAPRIGRIQIHVPSVIISAAVIGAGIGACAYGTSVAIIKIREWIHQRQLEEPVSLKASLIGGTLAGAAASSFCLSCLLGWI